MIYKINQLLNLVDEKITPIRFTGQEITKKEVSEWEMILESEGRQLKQAFILEADALPKEKQGLISQLIYLNNTVNHYLFNLTRLWESRSYAVLVKSFYLKTINFLELLITQLGTAEPEFILDQPISDFQLKAIKQELNRQYAALQTHLDAFDIDRQLKKLLLTGLFKFISKTQLSLRDINYFKLITKTILQEKGLNTLNLKGILCRYDFNLPEFFIYMVNLWQKSLLDIPSLHDQLELIVLEQDNLVNICGQKPNRLLANEESILTDLKCFLEEKSQTLKQLIQLRRMIWKDNELAKSSKRLQINLPVAQFALLIRLLVEKGVLNKENMGEMFSFFAANFYTSQTVFISAESLQKKSSDIEYATAKKMKGNVIGMLNWLNEHFTFTES